MFTEWPFRVSSWRNAMVGVGIPEVETALGLIAENEIARGVSCATSRSGDWDFIPRRGGDIS